MINKSRPCSMNYAKMRELLELLAEPAIAQRDAKLREELREIVGSSLKKQRAVLLMDGSRTQKQIVAETCVNQGHLSSMVGRLDMCRLACAREEAAEVVKSPFR